MLRPIQRRTGSWFAAYKPGLRSRATLALHAKGVLIGASQGIPLAVPATLHLSGRGALSQGIPLKGPATLQFRARGALTGASSAFHINGCGHVASAARATLSFTKNLVGRGRVVLSGSSAGPISAPIGAWAKPDRRGVWLLIVRADPRVLALDARVNGDPLGTPWTIENQGPPAILSTPLSTDDTVSQVLTVTLRQTAMDRHGPAVTVRAMRPAAVNPGAGLIPPTKVNAVLMRQNTADYADLCRVQWDWGDAAPGLVEITARIRPTSQAFNLAITDHPDFMVEGLAQRIKSKRPTESVYFGVARYERGQSGAVAYAAPITLQLDVGLPAVTATPDEVAGTAVIWMPDQFSAWLAGINPSAEAIWQTAAHRIKWIVAKGGRVVLDDFGTFAAIWRPARTRIDPVTGRVIQIPAQRAGSFTPSPGFDRGTQLGRLVRDVEVSA